MGSAATSHHSRVPFILWRWEHCVHDSGDNRRRKGRQHAADIAQRFVRWYMQQQQKPSVVFASQQAIYKWMDEVQSDNNRWRHGRCTRALVPRVVHAALGVLSYPQLKDIDRTDQHLGRRMSGIESLGCFLHTTKQKQKGTHPPVGRLDAGIAHNRLPFPSTTGRTRPLECLRTGMDGRGQHKHGPQSSQKTETLASLRSQARSSFATGSHGNL